MNRSGQFSREDVLDALERFDTELPSGAPRVRKAYKAFATEHGLPSATTIGRRFGSFTALMEEMRLRRREPRRGS